ASRMRAAFCVRIWYQLGFTDRLLVQWKPWSTTSVAPPLCARAAAARTTSSAMARRGCATATLSPGARGGRTSRRPSVALASEGCSCRAVARPGRRGGLEVSLMQDMVEQPQAHGLEFARGLGLDATPSVHAASFPKPLLRLGS